MNINNKKNKILLMSILLLQKLFYNNSLNTQNQILALNAAPPPPPPGLNLNQPLDTQKSSNLNDLITQLDQKKDDLNLRKNTLDAYLNQQSVSANQNLNQTLNQQGTNPPPPPPAMNLNQPLNQQGTNPPPPPPNLNFSQQSTFTQQQDGTKTQNNQLQQSAGRGSLLDEIRDPKIKLRKTVTVEKGGQNKIEKQNVSINDELKNAMAQRYKALHPKNEAIGTTANTKFLGDAESFYDSDEGE